MKRPMLTQRETATACGAIRRRREAGDLPGAVQDEKAIRARRPWVLSRWPYGPGATRAAALRSTSGPRF